MWKGIEEFRFDGKLETIRLSFDTEKSKKIIKCVVTRGKWCILKTVGDAQPYK